MKNIIILALALFAITSCGRKAASSTSTSTSETPSTTPKIDPRALASAAEFRRYAPEPDPAPSINVGTPGRFAIESNGMTGLFVLSDKLPMVSFSFFFDVPPIDEGSAAGYVEMAGDLLSQGTKTRTKAQIDAQVDFMGASLYSSSTGLFGRCLSKHADSLFAIMVDILRNPSFPESELKKLKKQAESGLASDKDDPSAIARNVGNKLTFGASHPYGNSMTEASLKNITTNLCRSYYEQYIKPNVTTVVVVGEIEHNKIQGLLLKNFRDWKRGDLPKKSFSSPAAPKETDIDIINRDGAVQSVIRVTYPIDLKPGDPDVIPARVATALFGGYFGSRLNQNLREKNAYTYGARASLDPDLYAGSLVVSTSVRNEVTDSALTQILYEMNRIRKTPIDETELNRVKSVLTGQFARSLEEPGTVARFALNTKRYNLPHDYYQTYLSNLNAVTIEDVQKMAKKYITPSRAHIVIVGAQDDIIDGLAMVAEDGRINYYNTDGTVAATADEVTNVSPRQIIDKYINAIGGANKLKSVDNISFTAEAELMGQVMKTELIRTRQGKSFMRSTMSGQTVQSIIYDGHRAKVSGMGQPAVLLEGQEAEEIGSEAMPFSVLYYFTDNYNLAVKGSQSIEGHDCYKLMVQKPDGSKSTEFYDKETGLKLSDMQTMTDGEATQTQTQLYEDYTAVNGILLPHTIITTGSLPYPLELKVKSVKINQQIPADTFKITE